MRWLTEICCIQVLVPCSCQNRLCCWMHRVSNYISLEPININVIVQYISNKGGMRSSRESYSFFLTLHDTQLYPSDCSACIDESAHQSASHHPEPEAFTVESNSVSAHSAERNGLGQVRGSHENSFPGQQNTFCSMSSRLSLLPRIRSMGVTPSSALLFICTQSVFSQDDNAPRLV